MRFQKCPDTCGRAQKSRVLKQHTSSASRTVPTPTVKAIVGTLFTSPPKNLAFAMIVSLARVFTRVRDTSEDPGSLKAICPSGPIPVDDKSQNYQN